MTGLREEQDFEVHGTYLVVDTLTYLHSDHLGSASLTTDATGAEVDTLRYHAFGQARGDGTMATDRRYTGQRFEAGLDLYDYRARYYDPVLGRFVQADTIIPNPSSPQDFNRYTYTLNNPLKYNDPTGHVVNLGTAAVGAVLGGAIGAVSSAGSQMIKNVQQGQPLTANIDPAQVAKDAAIGAAVGAVGGLTFGVGLAAGGAIAGAAGITSASGAAATAAGVATVAASSVAAGQTSRAAENILRGRSATEGLLQPGDMVMDAVVGPLTFKAFGGNFSKIPAVPSSGAGWRFQKYPSSTAGGAGGGGINNVDLATGKRVRTESILTGIDYHNTAPRPWYTKLHFHAEADIRFGTDATHLGRLLRHAHLPWEGLSAWLQAFPPGQYSWGPYWKLWDGNNHGCE